MHRYLYMNWDKQMRCKEQANCWNSIKGFQCFRPCPHTVAFFEYRGFLFPKRHPVHIIMQKKTVKCSQKHTKPTGCDLTISVKSCWLIRSLEKSYLYLYYWFCSPFPWLYPYFCSVVCWVVALQNRGSKGLGFKPLPWKYLNLLYISS